MFLRRGPNIVRMNVHHFVFVSCWQMAPLLLDHQLQVLLMKTRKMSIPTMKWRWSVNVHVKHNCLIQCGLLWTSGLRMGPTGRKTAHYYVWFQILDQLDVDFIQLSPLILADFHQRIKKTQKVQNCSTRAPIEDQLWLFCHEHSINYVLSGAVNLRNYQRQVISIVDSL